MKNFAATAFAGVLCVSTVSFLFLTSSLNKYLFCFLLNDRSTPTLNTPRPTSLESKTISNRRTELVLSDFLTTKEKFPTITSRPCNVSRILTSILVTRPLVEFSSNLKTPALFSMVLPTGSSTRDSRRQEHLSLLAL